MMQIEGEEDPKPYKVVRVTKEGEFVSHVAEYTTEEEARNHKRRLDWHFAIYRERKQIWPTTKGWP
jgi:hypothetical protein